MLWNATYETGLPVVDAQHKELFNQVDILLDASKADRIDDTLKFLEGYVVKHFATEEGMQKQIAYAKQDEHKKAHADFIATFKQLKNEYLASGNSPIAAMKMTRVALNWLKEHIRGLDREFAKTYLAAQK
jgi:hemerythrin-like metal-binding domain